MIFIKKIYQKCCIWVWDYVSMDEKSTCNIFTLIESTFYYINRIKMEKFKLIILNTFLIEL